MKITIDLSQSPAALLKDLTAAVRFALGANFFIEEGDRILPSGVTVDEVKNSPAAPALVAALPDLNIPVAVDAPVLPAASAVAAAQVDSAGNPWDGEIHSAGKTMIQNGTWKNKKGVDPAVVASTNARNKALLTVPIPADLPAVATVAALPPLVATVAALPDLPAVAVEVPVTDYASLAQYIAQQTVKLGDVVMKHVNVGLTHYGLLDATGAPTLPAMAHRPDMVLPFHKWLQTMLGA